MLPVDRFRDFISEHSLFEHSDRVLLALSGGKDSVLMAYLFNAAGYQFGIAHCNFKLRGPESDLDEDFTRDLARSFNVPFYSTSFNTEEHARDERISIEMAARELRYNWLEKIRTDNDYNAIAIAHHKNDSVETVLLNLIRGTGISGLHGILPKRDKLIRPLLFLSREDINIIISAEKIEFREDSSNSTVKFARNKIRLEIVPRLKELNPSLEQTFEQNSRRFAELEEYLKLQTSALRDRLFIVQPSGDYHINVPELKKLRPLRTFLFELFRPFGFKENVLEDLVASWDGISGKVFKSASHTILLDRADLILKKNNTDNLEEIEVFENASYANWGNYNFILRVVEAGGLELTTDRQLAYIDADKLAFPLKLRSWKQGDVFCPLGMTGKKKLSDFFINKKIPVNSKQLIPILENGSGDIIWIAGYQADNRYKVTSHTKKVIIFEMQK